jgi:hypothetical protein
MPKLKIEMQPFRIQINIKTSNKIYMPDGCILACKKIGLCTDPQKLDLKI